MFVILQYLLPHQLINRFAKFLANNKTPWLKNFLIRYFINRYPVNLAEAENSDPFSYASYNDFFTRALKPGARPIDPDEQSIVSPADGALGEFGVIKQETLIQAKNKFYTLSALLNNNQNLVQKFQEGSYATIYLAPIDYHRVHMPLDGRLLSMEYVPGKLFSVNPKAINHIDNIFARNERVLCTFETKIGHVCIILVGAMVVGSMETPWHGEVQNSHTYENQTIFLKKGQEMGRFKLGSTVILLFEKNKCSLSDNLALDMKIRLGRELMQAI
ncbi:MAG: archaetidylserine decarboxylase [Gammaproteobacteria bacterium]